MKASRRPSRNVRLTEFDFEAPAARQVSLAGDFNHWDIKALPMQKGLDGFWRVRVPLTPGRYEYRFCVDGGWQDDPFAQQKTANPVGSQNCVQIVA
jgi:1,4-alpha-glucan branching enzyme